MSERAVIGVDARARENIRHVEVFRGAMVLSTLPMVVLAIVVRPDWGLFAGGSSVLAALAHREVLKLKRNL